MILAQRCPNIEDMFSKEKITIPEYNKKWEGNFYYLAFPLQQHVEALFTILIYEELYTQMALKHERGQQLVASE